MRGIKALGRFTLMIFPSFTSHEFAIRTTPPTAITFSSQPSSPQETLHLDLKYIPGGDNAIRGLKRVSTPGCRVYKGFRELSQIRNGLGIAILSTSQGVMMDRKARKLQVGGEILCYIW